MQSKNFIKVETFAVLRQKLQKKTIVSIEFIVLDLCIVRNFMKIEAFAAFHAKLCPER